ncbi:MAG TPA: beta-eliminating lyase-related protein [Jatrophihabitans sp.]|nr:beta-eliminating lyase-related protein [Jatrophihabitans sp.]
MDAETRARYLACSHFLHGDGPVRPGEQLASVDPELTPDVYGEGGVVAELEHVVSRTLGKPAAVFLPSGTMAQGATLRVHADRRTSRTVLWHPTCHLELYEGQAHTRLHDLIGRPVGSPTQPLSRADLDTVAEIPAALLLELPQRELGGLLPSWQELQAQLAWASERGVATHLDGARLWEASAGLERSPAEIAGLFDTVYVSFYKGIGALPGCCVAGSEQDVAQVREWRRRLGGTLFGLWPLAGSALRLLPERLAEMPARLAHLRAIAQQLQGVGGVTVLPDPPQVPMVHLLLQVTAERFERNARRLAEQDGIWTWGRASPTSDPAVVRVELSAGRGTLALSPADAARVIGELLA